MTYILYSQRTNNVHRLGAKYASEPHRRRRSKRSPSTYPDRLSSAPPRLVQEPGAWAPGGSAKKTRSAGPEDGTLGESSGTLTSVGRPASSSRARTSKTKGIHRQRRTVEKEAED